MCAHAHKHTRKHIYTNIYIQHIETINILTFVYTCSGICVYSFMCKPHTLGTIQPIHQIIPLSYLFGTEIKYKLFTFDGRWLVDVKDHGLRKTYLMEHLCKGEKPRMFPIA